MSEAVMVAVIGGCFSLVGIIISAKFMQNRLTSRLETNQAILDTKISELTREVREHNNFAKRMPVVEEQIKDIKCRLSDLEKKYKEV